MNLGAPELIIIALVIFLLFGATRLPNAARSLGRSMRIFKSEIDEMKQEGQSNATPAIDHADVTAQQAQPNIAAQPNVAAPQPAPQTQVRPQQQ